MEKTRQHFVSAIAVAALLLFWSWLLLLRSLVGPFQDAHGSDALAMIRVLFPLFWVLLVGYVVLGCLTIYLRLEQPWLHFFLLCGITLTLFFTPFLLSGFSWSPDSLFHGGVASYMPEILSGNSLPFSNYAASYPLSFLVTFLVEAVTGLTIFQYSLYVYPVISIVAFTLSAYLLVWRLFGSLRSFISLLVALPALHFIEPHVSPYSFGTILLLATLITLTSTSRKMRGLSFGLMFLLVLTHPISPLSLGIFFVAAWLLRFFIRFWSRRSGHVSSSLITNMSWETTFLLGIIWLLWTLNWAAKQYPSVSYAISKIVTLQFLQDLMLVAEFTGGGGFIYGGLQLLGLLIYGVFGLFALIALLFALRHLRAAKWDRHHLLQLFFAGSSLIFAVYAYVLYLGTGEHVLLGRGLLFFILTSAIAFTLQLVPPSQTRFQKPQLLLLFMVILCLFVTYPLNAYSKEAYNTHTPTSGAGLRFIGTYLDLTSQSISMAADRQLAAYIDLRQNLTLSKYPPNLTASTPGYIALRINSYFLISMRHELTFENNSFTRLRDTLEATPTYNKMYTNAYFDLYDHNLDE